MTIYLGKEVLCNFIKNAKNPSFPSFVNKYENQITEWSLGLGASNSRELHTIWVSRFNDCIRETRADVPLKKSKFIPAKWDKLYEELVALRDMMQRSRTEGQRLANMSLTNAATRSLRLLENHNAEGVVADEAEEEKVADENELNEEEATPVVDRLHMLYFKKFQKEAFNDNEKVFLAGVMNKKSCIQEKLFGHASKLLLKQDLDAGEEIMLKLTLSSIVNTMEPEGYETLKNILSQEEMTSLENSPSRVHTGLSDVDMKVLDKVLESGGEEIDLEAIEEEILREQLRLRGLKMKTSDQYKMLDILKYMIECIDHCNEDDSELTCYRHFAKLLDCLFKYTNLMLLDGEPACIAVKEEMIAGHSLHPCLSFNVLSTTAIRKIDAIVAAQVEKEHVEFSANEWKKSNATITTAIKQQSKNLRSNLSILNQLERKFDIQTKSILAVDFVGYEGYMYSLKKREGIAVATLVTELMVPTKKSDLEYAVQTINTLFVYKNHAVKLAEEVKAN